MLQALHLGLECSHEQKDILASLHQEQPMRLIKHEVRHDEPWELQRGRAQ